MPIAAGDEAAYPTDTDRSRVAPYVVCLLPWAVWKGSEMKAEVESGTVDGGRHTVDDGYGGR